MSTPRPAGFRAMPGRHVSNSSSDNKMSLTSRFFARAGAAIFVVTIAASLVAFVGVVKPAAQDSTSAEPGGGIVAVVDGDVITENDLSVAYDEFSDQLARVSVVDRRKTTIDLLIHIRLAAKAAEKDGIASDPDVVSRMNLVRDRVLYTEYLNRIFDKAVTEDAARKLFADEQANQGTQYELHVRHILVTQKDAAEEIIKELNNGGDFAKIAEDQSVDTGSASKGGDIGFIQKGDTVQPFEDAAFALKVGEYTKEPVESQFGYHVIQLEEKREAPPKTFEQEAQRIQQDLVRNAFNKAIADLTDAATIDIKPAPGVQPDAQSATPGDQPAAPAQ